VSDQENIIALAEWLGWKCTSKTTYPDGEVYKTYWRDPVHGTSSNSFEDLPNPYTSADDCDAVIRKLTDRDWQVDVCNGRSCGRPFACVRLWSTVNDDWPEIWQGDDYKHGVCELALKVIDNE
jgi:hypothetical protein